MQLDMFADAMPETMKVQDLERRRRELSAELKRLDKVVRTTSSPQELNACIVRCDEIIAADRSLREIADSEMRRLEGALVAAFSP